MARDVEIFLDANPAEMEMVLDRAKVVLDHRDTVIQFSERGAFRPWHRDQKELLTLYCKCDHEHRGKILARKIAEKAIGKTATIKQKTNAIPMTKSPEEALEKCDFFLFTGDDGRCAMITVRIEDHVECLTIQVARSTVVADNMYPNVISWPQEIESTKSMDEIQIRNTMFFSAFTEMINRQADLIVGTVDRTGSIVDNLCNLFAMRLEPSICIWRNIFFKDSAATGALLARLMNIFYKSRVSEVDSASSEHDILHDRILNRSGAENNFKKEVFQTDQGISICLVTATNPERRDTVCRISAKHELAQTPTLEVTQLSEAIFEQNLFKYPDHIYDEYSRASYNSAGSFANNLMLKRETDGEIIECRNSAGFFQRYIEKSQDERKQFAERIRQIRDQTAPRGCVFKCNIPGIINGNAYYEIFYDTFMFTLQDSSNLIVQLKTAHGECTVYMAACNPSSNPPINTIILDAMVKKGHVCTDFERDAEEIKRLLDGQLNRPVNFVKRYNFDNNHDNPPYYKKYLSDRLLKTCIIGSYDIWIRLVTPTPEIDRKYRIHNTTQDMAAEEHAYLLSLHESIGAMDMQKAQELDDMNTEGELRALTAPSLHVVTKNGKRFCLFQQIIEWTEFAPADPRPDSGIIRRISVVPIPESPASSDSETLDND